MKDADGKGSRKLIVPILTVVGERSDEKGETRTTTIIPLAAMRRTVRRPNGVVTSRTTVVPLLSSWERRSDAAGHEERQVFIAPLLSVYTRETGLEAAAEAVPGDVVHRQDMQCVLALSGFHRKSERGVASSWGYVNILLGFSRSGGQRTLRLFHLIPIPLGSTGEKMPHPD